MTKDFEARAKQHEAFETEWKFQQGSLMLKNENEGKEWKRVVADHFFQLGARYGREAGPSEREEAITSRQFGKTSINNAFHEGRKAGLDEAAWIAESEEREYIKSMKEMDQAGHFERGTGEAGCAVTAKYIAEAIRAAKGNT